MLPALTRKKEVSIGPRPFRHGYYWNSVFNIPIIKCFNWATSFQTWIQPPFFGLYCYRKKADFRTYRQLLWILSESRSLFKTIIDMCWPFAHLPEFWTPPRCAKFVWKTVIILPIRLVEWPCTNRVPALQISASYYFSLGLYIDCATTNLVADRTDCRCDLA